MKRFFTPILLVSLAALASEAAAQSFQPPWWLDFKTPSLNALILRAESLAEHDFEVFYPGAIDETTLDEEDLWVVTRQGFNAAAKLVAGRPVYERDTRAPRAGDELLPAPNPEERLGVLATYRVVAPGSLWNTQDNGTYTILIEPIQVGFLKSQDYLPAVLLGSFRVAVGEPEPAKPTVVLEMKQEFQLNEEIAFSVTYKDERTLDPRTVGEGDVYLVGQTSTFPGTVPEIWRLAQVEMVSKVLSEKADQATVQYRVGNPALRARGRNPSVLFPGTYELRLSPNAVCDADGGCVGDLSLGTFSVAGELPVPPVPEATVLVKRSQRQYFASVQLALPAGTMLTSWGSLVLEGDTFTADIQLAAWPELAGLVADSAAEAALAYRPSQIWGDSRNTFSLGLPKPGNYKVNLRYRGQVFSEESFEAQAIDLGQLPPPTGGQLWIENDSTQFIAFLEMAYDSDLQVQDWGTPQLSNNTYRIDLKAVKRDGAPNPGQSSGPVRVYELGKPAKEATYLVEVYLGEQLFLQGQFKVEASTPAPAPPAQPTLVKIEQIGEEVYANVAFDTSPNEPCLITEWGAVVRRGNVFYLDAKSVTSGPLTPENRTCAHRYRLLPSNAPGEAPAAIDLGPDGQPVLYSNYFVVFRLNNAIMAKVPFTREFDGLRVATQVQDIWEPKTEPQEFSITWRGGPGLDLNGVRAIDVTVRAAATDYSQKAAIKKIDTLESQPPQYVVRYAVTAPGGTWDFADNGRYDISYVRVPDGLDPAAAAARPITVASFFARIGPDLPESAEAAKIEVKVEATAQGQVAKILVQPGVSFEITDWGESELNGDTFFVTPETREPKVDPNQGGGGNQGNAEPAKITKTEQAHEYTLGNLKPGLYVFVFKTNGPASRIHFWVNDPNGGPSPTDALTLPRDNWRVAALQGADDGMGADEADPDQDGSSNLIEYAMGTNPLDATDKATPSVYLLERAGQHHAVLTYRGVTSAVDVGYVIEASTDLKSWAPLGNQLEEIDREPHLNGTETVSILLKVPAEEAPLAFLRVRVEAR